VAHVARRDGHVRLARLVGLVALLERYHVQTPVTDVIFCQKNVDFELLLFKNYIGFQE
jgi:hypothetical protein